MTETITNLQYIVEECEEQDGDIIHKLVIETSNNEKKWKAFLAIHIPSHCLLSCLFYNNIIPDFICEFNVNDVKLNTFTNIIGQKIVSKEVYHIDEHNIELSAYSKLHMTKLVCDLDNGDKLNMIIGEVYNSRINNYYNHSGGDIFNLV